MRMKAYIAQAIMAQSRQKGLKTGTFRRTSLSREFITRYTRPSSDHAVSNPLASLNRMKALFPLLALLLPFCVYQAVHAQETPELSKDYDYLTRMHVPSAVVRCVAAFDHWVELTPKYDTFIVPDRRVLSAKIESDSPVFSVGNPIPVDTIVIMRAFAKARSKPQWTRVDSRCGVRDGRVVGVALTPDVKPKIVR